MRERCSDSRSGCSGLPTLPATSFAQADVLGHPNARRCDTQHDLFVRVDRGRLARVSHTVNAAHGPEKDLKAKTKSGDHYRPVLRSI